jgi:hypothetical protein
MPEGETYYGRIRTKKVSPLREIFKDERLVSKSNSATAKRSQSPSLCKLKKVRLA